MLDLEFCVNLSAKDYAERSKGGYDTQTHEAAKLMLMEGVSERPNAGAAICRSWTSIAKKQGEYNKATGAHKAALDAEITKEMAELRKYVSNVIEQQVKVPNRAARDKLRKAVSHLYPNPNRT